MEASKGEAQQVLDALVEQTQDKRIVWEQSTHEADEYGAKTKRFAYYIRSRDGDGSAPYIFELYSNSDTPTVTWDSGDPEVTDSLRSLYMIAKRSASGFLDGLAAEVLRDLEEGQLPF